MRAPQLISYAVNRFSYHHMTGFSGQATDRAVSRSAAALAAFGIGVSTFSLKQMINNGPKRF